MHSNIDYLSLKVEDLLIYFSIVIQLMYFVLSVALKNFFDPERGMDFLFFFLQGDKTFSLKCLHDVKCTVNDSFIDFLKRLCRHCISFSAFESPNPSFIFLER